MHETYEKIQCNAARAIRNKNKTNKQHFQNYGPKEWCSAEMGFRLLIPFSLKYFLQNINY